MMLFKDVWQWRQEQESIRVPLTGDEAWAIVSVCFLLITFMGIIWSVETSRVNAADKSQAQGCQCSE